MVYASLYPVHHGSRKPLRQYHAAPGVNNNNYEFFSVSYQEIVGKWRRIVSKLQIFLPKDNSKLVAQDLKFSYLTVNYNLIIYVCRE